MCPKSDFRPNRRRKGQPRRLVAPEPQAVELVTITWMMATLTVLMCEVGSIIVRLIVHRGTSAATLELFGGILTFAAIVIGLVVVILTPLVIRLRQTPPPPGIVVFAVAVALSPLMDLVARALY